MTEEIDTAKIDETPAPAPQAAPESAAPVQMTTEQLAERMARHHSSQLRKSFGTDDPSAIKSQLEQLAQLQEAQAEAERQKMSDLEKLQSDLQAAQQRADEAQLRYEEMQFDSIVNATCAKLGVKNVDYASYELQRAASSVDELDPEAHLSSLLEDPRKRAALGFVEAVAKPATTTPDVDATNRAPAPGGKPDVVDANAMSREEFAKHAAMLGLQLG